MPTLTYPFTGALLNGGVTQGDTLGYVLLPFQGVQDKLYHFFTVT